MSKDARSFDCETVHQLLPAYGLGATDPDETEMVRAHLAECPAAAAEVAGYADLAEAMLFSAPPLRPPASLAVNLRAATGSVVSNIDASPGRTELAAARGARPQLRRSWTWPKWGLAAAAVAALLLVLLAFNLYWTRQVSELQGAQQQLAARLEQQMDVLAQVGEGDYLRIALPAGPAAEGTDAYATVICKPDRPAGYILAEKLPPLPPDQAYQVWLLEGDERTSGGLFTVDAAGTGGLVFQAPKPMGEYEAVDITAEPAAGSPAPTSPPVIRGKLYDGGYPAS